MTTIRVRYVAEWCGERVDATGTMARVFAPDGRQVGAVQAEDLEAAKRVAGLMLEDRGWAVTRDGVRVPVADLLHWIRAWA